MVIFELALITSKINKIVDLPFFHYSNLEKLNFDLLYLKEYIYLLQSCPL